MKTTKIILGILAAALSVIGSIAFGVLMLIAWYQQDFAKAAFFAVLMLASDYQFDREDARVGELIKEQERELAEP
jgi:hypothetical protein